MGSRATENGEPAWQATTGLDTALDTTHERQSEEKSHIVACIVFAEVCFHHASFATFVLSIEDGFLGLHVDNYCRHLYALRVHFKSIDNCMLMLRLQVHLSTFHCWHSLRRVQFRRGLRIDKCRYLILSVDRMCGYRFSVA